MPFSIACAIYFFSFVKLWNCPVHGIISLLVVWIILFTANATFSLQHLAYNIRLTTFCQQHSTNNFPLKLSYATFLCNFPLLLPLATFLQNILLQLPAPTSSSNFRKQFSVSTSGNNFLYQLSVSTSGNNFLLQFPVTISGYNFLIQFPVAIFFAVLMSSIVLWTED